MWCIRTFDWWTVYLGTNVLSAENCSLAWNRVRNTYLLKVLLYKSSNRFLLHIIHEYTIASHIIGKGKSRMVDFMYSTRNFKRINEIIQNSTKFKQQATKSVFRIIAKSHFRKHLNKSRMYSSISNRTLIQYCHFLFNELEKNTSGNWRDTRNSRPTWPEPQTAGVRCQFGLLIFIGNTFMIFLLRFSDPVNVNITYF